MKQQPLFVAIANQKGGVGKSSITVLMASYFHCLKDKRVLVVDCDYPQHSILKMRENDLQRVLKNDSYKQLMLSLYGDNDRKAYPVIASRPDRANQTASEFLEKEQTEYDLVLIDLPGTVNTQGILQTILNMDYIFVPVIHDRIVMNSSMAFVSALQDIKRTHPDVPLKEVFLFWNRFNKRYPTETLAVYQRIMDEMGLKVLQTRLPEATRFSRELSLKGEKQFFRCTLFPPAPKLLKDSCIEQFAGEVSELINL